MRLGRSSNRFSLKKAGVFIVITGFGILMIQLGVAVEVVVIGLAVLLPSILVALFCAENSGCSVLTLIHLHRKLRRERRITLLQAALF